MNNQRVVTVSFAAIAPNAVIVSACLATTWKRRSSHACRESLAGILALVCAISAPSSAKSQAVRDSAGIRIVTSSKPSWTAAQQLKLAPAPSLIIGDRDGEHYLFSRIRGAFTLADGRIVVADGSSNELRVFDATGAYLKKFGHVGDGPGEFRSITSIARLAGDTIVVLHDRASVSWFASSGVFIRRLNEDGQLDGRGRPVVLKNVALALNGGLRLVLDIPLGRSTATAGSPYDLRVSHALMDGNGKLVRQLGELPVQQMIGSVNGGEKPWLGAEAVFAGAGSTFYIGYGIRYSISRYSLRGGLEQIARREWTAPAITQKEINAFVEEWLLRWSKTGGAETERDRKDMLDDAYSKTLPAFSAMIADHTGRLWVRAAKSIDAAVAGSLNDYSIGPSTWSVFGNDGVWLGEVVMPARFRPTDIGADYVLGIARDDDGVQTVARYRLSVR